MSSNNNSNNIVTDFIQAKSNLLKLFNCDDSFYIKPEIDAKWHLRELDGTCFISYGKEAEKPTEAVVTRKNGEFYIIEKAEYTMVVCIECVKIALILKNSNKIS
jgi:hypothetical protein